MIKADNVLVELFILKVVDAGHIPFVTGLYVPAINPEKSDPEGFVTPFKVTVLPSLLVNTADPVRDPQVVFTTELAAKVT